MRRSARTVRAEEARVGRKRTPHLPANRPRNAGHAARNRAGPPSVGMETTGTVTGRGPRQQTPQPKGSWQDERPLDDVFQADPAARSTIGQQGHAVRACCSCGRAMRGNTTRSRRPGGVAQGGAPACMGHSARTPAPPQQGRVLFPARPRWRGVSPSTPPNSAEGEPTQPLQPSAIRPRPALHETLKRKTLKRSRPCSRGISGARPVFSQARLRRRRRLTCRTRAVLRHHRTRRAKNRRPRADPPAAPSTASTRRARNRPVLAGGSVSPRRPFGESTENRKRGMRGDGWPAPRRSPLRPLKYNLSKNECKNWNIPIPGNPGSRAEKARAVGKSIYSLAKTARAPLLAYGLLLARHLTTC